MADMYVGEDRYVFDENSMTFEERALELERMDVSDMWKRKHRNRSPFKRYTQQNLERTKELVWLAMKHPVAMAIFLIFMDKMDKKNGVVCSNQALCELLDVSERTISRAISALRKRGFITVLKTGRENVYAVNDTVTWKDSGNKLYMSTFHATVILSLNEQDADVQEAVLASMEADDG